MSHKSKNPVGGTCLITAVFLIAFCLLVTPKIKADHKHAGGNNHHKNNAATADLFSDIMTVVFNSSAPSGTTKGSGYSRGNVAFQPPGNNPDRHSRRAFTTYPYFHTKVILLGSGPHQQTHNAQKGLIYFCNGDSAQGWITIGLSMIGETAVTYIQQGNGEPRMIGNELIKRVHIYADSATISNTFFTDFINIKNDQRLWRILYNGRFKILDLSDVPYVPGEEINDIWLTDDQNHATLIKAAKVKNMLISTANANYNLSLDSNSFKEREDVLNYLRINY